MDLVAWLRQTLDEDERTANGAGDVTGDRSWRATADPSGHHVEPEDFMAQRFGRVVLRAGADMGLDGDESRAIAEHIARHNPASAAADIAAKRAIVEEHTCRCPDPNCADCGACSGAHHSDPTTAPCLTLKLLASAYAHRPGYQDAWRP